MDGYSDCCSVPDICVGQVFNEKTKQWERGDCESCPDYDDGNCSDC